MKKIIYSCYLFILFVVFFSFQNITCSAEEIEQLQGQGTIQNPYLIQDAEDLAFFRKELSEGEHYNGKYIVQTKDIDVEYDNNLVYDENSFFSGIYNGDGHYINNYRVNGDMVSFFGYLDGYVINLNFKNVDITANKCGVIAFASVNEKQNAIINCSVTGKIDAIESGGIIYNPRNTNIINCFTSVDYYGENTKYGIAAIYDDCKIYSCMSIGNDIGPNIQSKTSKKISKETYSSNKLLKNMKIKVALSYELFFRNKGIKLNDWEMKDGNIYVSKEKGEYIKILDFIGDVLPVVAAAILIFYVVYRELTTKMHSSNTISLELLVGCISLFYDCAIISKRHQNIGICNIVFAIEINFLFLFLLISIIRNKRKKICFEKICNTIKKNYPIIIVSGIVLVVELLQFRNTPRYDASLYYGSFYRACKNYSLDFWSYIGQFICWKWIQGSALLIAPLEFVFPGKAIGVYISNCVLSQITVLVLYKYLNDNWLKSTKMLNALISGLLIFCPFQIGMFSYLCFDNYLVYFLIWLVYSYSKRNHLMVLFCGYLLCFTKITGAVLYVVFVFVSYLLEINKDDIKLLHVFNKNKRENILFIIYMIPAFLFLISFFIGDWFIIQNFYGSSTVPIIGKKSLVSFMNTSFQCFVWAFRWFFVFILGYYLFLKRKKVFLYDIITERAECLNVSVFIASLATYIMLIIYNGDAECPRYTAFMNVVYVFVFSVIINKVINKKKNRELITIFVSVILFLQAFITIDPSIISMCPSIDMGNNRLYKLAFDNDERQTMNLGKNYSYGYGAVCDLYAYNMEYNVYDSLLRELVTDNQIKDEDSFYLLDTIEYELHLGGSVQYNIYWNNNNFTYDDSQREFKVNVRSVMTDNIVSEIDANKHEKIYLLVPMRVNEDAALRDLRDKGYIIKKCKVYSNPYGKIKLYTVNEKDAKNV